MSAPQGHTHYGGGAKKGSRRQRREIDATIKGDYVWVYKKLGGKKALLGWAQNPSGSNDEFWKQFVRIAGGGNNKGSLGGVVNKFVEDRED